MTEAAHSVAALPDPIRMVLYCPRCLHQHVDAPDEATGWTNPPHLSHRCAKCKLVWRPADVPTRGVMLLETRGERDADPLIIAIAQAAREQQVKDPSGLTPVEMAAQVKIDDVERRCRETQAELDEARAVCTEGYAVLRAMAEEMDTLDAPKVQAALNHLSAGRRTKASVLPFACENRRALNIASASRAEIAQLTRQLQERPARPAASLAQPSTWLTAELPSLSRGSMTRGVLFVLIGFICMMMLTALFNLWERAAGL